MKRRDLLQSGALVLLLGAHHLARGASIMAVRVWPAPDYSRVTIESDTALKAKQFFVPSPPRLVVDIEGVQLNAALKELVAKVGPADPTIEGIRVGQFAPGVVRLVVDLKQPISPQVFTLAPVAAYQHRLVFDLYPTQVADPLEVLIAERLKVSPPPPEPVDALGELMAQHGQKPGFKAEPIETAAVISKPNTATQSIATNPSSTSGNALKSLNSGTDRLIIIALDPGHGGEDPGARGRRGSREKNVTLTIARKLKTIIDAEPNMRAVLTRDGDYYLPLSMRVEKARRVKSDLFVSIHADAFVRPNASGSSVFALSERGATSAAAGWLAKRENAADLIGGVNLGVKDRYLAQTLLDLSQTATIQDSLKVARAVLSEIGDVNHLHKQKVEQAGFAVLKAPDIPSILVETAFISNPDEERRLNDDAYQDKMAQALLRGIKRYFAKNPPLSRSTVASLQ